MMSLALQGVGLMAEYCAQCAKQYGMSNGFIKECKAELSSKCYL